MTGPILGFWGDQDQLAGLANVEKLRAELTERGVDFELIIYPGLGHGFMAASGLDPEHAAYDAALDAWTRTVAFLHTHLADRGTPE
jgi:carboxymethylenebutenolidase